MKTNKQIVQELVTAQQAVQKLAELGFKVLGVTMGNLHPVINIAPPGQRQINKRLQGAEPISVRLRHGYPERIFAAKFGGCLVTWTAEIDAMKGAA